jgi:hypothetical protein
MGRSAFGEQIAVLDGFEEGSSSIDYDTSESDGRIGQMRADASQYAEVTARGPAGITATRRMNVLDASSGANYSGGSAYAPGLPLLPSTVGLAAIPSVLPPRMNVIDPSGGANYSGGSSWTGGIPLISSNSGLAAALIQGGYGRDGLGRVRRGRGGRGLRGLAGRNDGYGRAGLGQPMAGADNDLCGAFASIELGRLSDMEPNDGRIGQDRARVDQYARMVAPNVLVKTNVIDPSGGANYTGGSDYSPGMPLIVSNAGLAGLDRMGDNLFRTALAKIRKAGVKINVAAVQKAVGKKVLDRLRAHAMRIQQIWGDLDSSQKAEALQILRSLGLVRRARANILRASSRV